MKNDIHDLGLVLESRVKLVLVESWDERRVLETLTGWPYGKAGFYVWSATEGLRHLGFGVSCKAARKLLAGGGAQAGEAGRSGEPLCILRPASVPDEPKLVRLLRILH